MSKQKQLENMTLEKIIADLKEKRSNIMFDLKQDWLFDSQEDRRNFETSLLLLNSSISNLETILENGCDQLFNSAL